MATRERHLDAFRKVIASLLMLSIVLMSFHTHGIHGDAGPALSTFLSQGAVTSDASSPSQVPLPETGNEACAYCTLMGQLALPAFAYAHATFVVHRIARTWTTERAPPPPVPTRLYRPPIAGDM